FVVDEAIELRVKGRCRARGLLFVEPQAVDLNDAGVDDGELQIDLRRSRRLVDPPRRRGAHVDPAVGSERAERAHHLDRADRVPEAVAGDVVNDAHLPAASLACHLTLAAAGCGSATLSTSSNVCTGMKRMSRFTSSGSSARSGSLRAGSTSSLIPWR